MFRSEYRDAPVLWLDAGEFAGDSTKAGQFQTETLLEGMGRLGYGAANVTERELTMGLEALQALAAKASFPLLSANLVYQASGEPVFAATTVKTYPPGSWRGKEPLRVGVIGVMRGNPGFLIRTADDRKVVIGSPVKAAAKYVPGLRASSDLVVVLANLGPDEVDALVAAVPGIDLVLAGHGGLVTDRTAPPPGASVVYGGDEGKRIGEVRAFFGTKGLAQLTATELFLDKRYPFDATLKDFEDQANLKINDFYREAADSTPTATPGRVPAAALFSGADACKSCHAEAYATWERSRHAKAMDALLQAGQEYNPQCTACHVTGYRRANGFQNLKATPAFANVQCEACHDASGGHLEDPSKPYGKIDVNRCLSCHTRENSPDFEFASYWERIKH
jgi:2',3'-cyclic-nucleotide 2'-phosphodiesterase (5'-nucleotidase family)